MFMKRWIRKVTEKVNKQSSVFLYEQIKRNIMNKIDRGYFKKGDRLPTEKELGEQFQSSRITVRRAMKELEDEGIIEVIHGKGTFVKGIKLPIHILDLNGFTEGLSTSENHFTKEVLSKEIITSDDSMMKKFNREYPFDILKLVRLIKDEHEVFSVDFAYLPTFLYPNIISKIDHNVSTFEIIHDNYGLAFKNAKKHIEVSTPTMAIRKLFNISNTDPVLKVKKLIYDFNDKPIHFSKYYLLGSRVSFDMNVSIDEPNGWH